MTTTSERAPYVLAPGDGEAVWFLGTLMTIKVGSAGSGGAFTILEQQLPPGFAPPPHVHRSEEEAFYLLDGALAVTCGDRSWEALPGSFVLLPRGLPHGFAVVGDAPARLLQITAPAGFEGFAAEAGEPAASRTLPPAGPPPDVPRLIQAAARHGIDILPPPGA